jgi:phosphatidylserine/phosphatidylglycerophosphate/cardiolipin synthase-like enzyme
MPIVPEGLLDALYDLARVLPGAELGRLCDRLAAIEGFDRRLVREAGANLYSPAFCDRYADVADLWCGSYPEVRPREVAAALLAIERTIAQERSRLGIELVWTGPGRSSRFRRTDGALLELIGRAREELTLMSYAIARVPEVVEAVRSAIGRGVRVRLIAEELRDRGGRSGIDREFGGLRGKIEVYVWPEELRESLPGGSLASMHAKVAIADRARALVTSANLTGYALRLNMELGTLIESRQFAGELMAMFDELIRDGVLRRLG